MVSEPVALLHDLEHRALLGLGRLREERLVDVRVEAAVRLDLGEALAVERVLQLAVDEANAFLELCLLVLLRGGQRALQVVEHRQELLHEPLVGARDQALLVTRNPLAIVLEVGSDALEVVEQLVALGLELADGLRPVFRHDVLASSSTTSASSITSSSESGAPLPPSAEACWASAAWA